MNVSAIFKAAELNKTMSARDATDAAKGSKSKKSVDLEPEGKEQQHAAPSGPYGCKYGALLNAIIVWQNVNETLHTCLQLIFYLSNFSNVFRYRPKVGTKYRSGDGF